MRDFLTRHSYLVVWVASLIIVGAIAYAIFYLNGYVPTIPLPGSAGQTTTPTASPSTPAGINVTFAIKKSANGNIFAVYWKNLPAGTTLLDVYRGKTGTPQSQWVLWQSISVGADQLGGGSAQFNTGNNDESGYSFYAQAGDGSNNNSDNGNGNGDNTTSPPWTPPTPPAPPANPTSTPTSTPPGSDTSSTPSNSTSSNPSTGPTTSSTPPGTSNPTPSGTPYYSPQVQIEEYGSGQSGNFWVQYVGKNIQIGWQDLPANTTEITVTRSENQDGPWTVVLTQQNPETTGTHSIQIVDDTVGQPYYYDLSATNGTTPIATYGPVYLASQ